MSFLGAISLIKVVEEKASTSLGSRKGRDVGEDKGQSFWDKPVGCEGEDSPDLGDSWLRFLAWETDESGRASRSRLSVSVDLLGPEGEGRPAIRESKMLPAS